MMDQESEDAMFQLLVSRVHDRARKVLVERDRFEWFVSQLEPRRGVYTVEQLCHYLHAPVTWPAQRERVLVLLSMNEDVEALHILHDYDPAQSEERLVLFRAMAIQAWQDRYGVREDFIQFDRVKEMS